MDGGVRAKSMRSRRYINARDQSIVELVAASSWLVVAVTEASLLAFASSMLSILLEKRALVIAFLGSSSVAVDTVRRGSSSQACPWRY
jgi:hypothetical protein